MKHGDHVYLQRLCDEAVRRFWRMIRIPEESSACWEWTGCKDAFGYGMLGCRMVEKKAHRLAYKLFIGDIPEGQCVCHRCDNPGCVNPKHLWLGTRADNNQDCDQKQRRPYWYFQGENNVCAKVTAEQVLSIRTEFANGTATPTELAQRHGIGRSAVWQIVRGKNWKDVGGPISTATPRARQKSRWLTAEEVRAIRLAYTGEYGHMAVLRKQYGITIPTIVNVLSGRSWKDVDPSKAPTYVRGIKRPPDSEVRYGKRSQQPGSTEGGAS